MTSHSIISPIDVIKNPSPLQTLHQFHQPEAPSLNHHSSIVFAGRQQPQQPGSHASPERQTPRGVIQLPKRSEDIAGRPDHSGQSQQTEKRVAAPVQSGVMTAVIVIL